MYSIIRRVTAFMNKIRSRKRRELGDVFAGFGHLPIKDLKIKRPSQNQIEKKRERSEAQGLDSGRAEPWLGAAM